MAWQSMGKEGDGGEGAASASGRAGDLCFLPFPKTIEEESPQQGFVTQNPQLCPKKAFLGEEMRYFCLRKQTKPAQLALAATSGAEEQWGWMSIIPVHHSCLSFQSIMTGRASWQFQPVHPHDLHLLYPGARSGLDLLQSPLKPFGLCA